MALIAAILALVGAGCGDEESAGSERSVRIGYEFDLDPADLGDAVAQDRLEAEHGISVETREMGSTQGVVGGLRRGEIELASLNQSSAINAVRAGADLRAILGTKIRPEWILVATEGIESAEDLEGKRVGVFGPGSETVHHVNLTLAEAGLGSDDVQISALGESTNRAAALASDRIDATPLEYADVLRLLEEGVALTEISRLRDLVPEFAPTVLVASEEFLREQPDLAEDVVAGLIDGYQFVSSEDGAQAWSQVAQAEALADDPQKIVSATYDYFLEIGLWPTREPITEQQYVRSCGFWLETGQVEECPPFAEVWDTGLWAAAASGD